jgi:hypothetical protein
VLEQVAREAGHSELGRKAAKTITESLGGIYTGRDGRVLENSNGIAKWKRWLKALRFSVACRGKRIRIISVRRSRQEEIEV